MKVSICNFGPIKEFTIDLYNNLTFIYGKNNIGKSYAIMLNYLILKHLIDLELRIYPPMRLYYRENEPVRHRVKRDEFAPLLRKVNEQISGHKDISIKEEVEALIEDMLGGILIRPLEESLSTSFPDINSMTNKHTTDRLKITVDFKHLSFDIVIKDRRLAAENVFYKEDLVVRKSKRPQRSHYDSARQMEVFYYSEPEHFLDAITRFLFHSIWMCSTEVNGVFSDVYFLPASRSGLYQALNAFSQIIAELAKKRSFLSTKIELPGISVPVSDYFLRLSDVNVRLRSSKETAKSASEIETKLLNGEITFDPTSKKILYKPHGIDVVVEMTAASSMVAEISPIVLYLKHIIGVDMDGPRHRRLHGDSKGKPLLFIEEPEAHLHPEAQTVLMDIFGNLVKSGVSVVVTSHSNYMFSKLNNLILSGKIKIQEIGAYLLYQTAEGSIGKSMDMNQLGIDDENFSRVSEALYNESVSLLDEYAKRSEE